MNYLAPSFQQRRALRVLKGRPAFRRAVRQSILGRGMLEPTVAPDPILDLFVARKWARTGDPRWCERYGAIRQSVVSPLSVRLP